MIELRSVNKYFNKGKKNEIHVINNTTLNLDKGLVAFLGNSGCGKTTLLNTIGGLDKIKKGSIYVNGQKISSKLSYKVDKIRNLNVGYIFQDYKLIDNMSVYDNVALVLTIMGLKNKNEIKKRVEYVLDKVGMLRYKKRPAAMLSGGERQRVGIARAIVKNPTVILADEPTGNLDSKNSLEIMKIIKAISKEKLVILVTHETQLAKFYASRIIELEDGKIVKDYINDHTNDLDYDIENEIYLKDLKNHKKTENINIYSDNEEKVNLDIVIKNGNIYIKSNDNKKIEVVDENSGIEFINDHYKKVTSSDIDKYDFDFDSIIDDNYKKKYTSIFNPIKTITNGFKKLFNFPILKKILLIGFFISAMFIMYSVSSISATLKIDDKKFVTKNRNYLEILTKKINVGDYLNYESKENINYLLPGDSIVSFKVKYNEYYQTASYDDSLTGSLSSISMISKNNLIYGTMPEETNDIVVDKLSIEKLFGNEDLAKMSGIKNISDLLNKQVYINNMEPFKIVGITDLSSPSIYVNNSEFINIIYNSSEDEKSIQDYNLFINKIELKEGRYPTNDYEVIVNISNKDAMKLNKQIDTKINNNKLTVVGYYKSPDDLQYMLVNNNMIKYNLIETKSNIIIYSNDKNNTLNEFRDLNLNIKDTYIQSKTNYKKEIKENVQSTLLISGIILLISLVEIFLMIRSSFLSRIKEIGIYRAIGVKKKDIYKMFFGEIFAITTIASMPGLLFMAYVLKTLSNVKYLSSLFLINPLIIIISIIFVYLFNIVIGLIPVFNTLRKRPAEILSRHDLD